MLGGVAIPGRIATTNVATGQSHSEMDPRIAELQALLASLPVRVDIPDLFNVWALRGHPNLPPFTEGVFIADSGPQTPL